MRVRSDRRWSFPASAEEVWEQMCTVDRYRTWWPWLRNFEAESLAAGDRWICSVQPPLPYSLRFVIAMDDVVAGESVATTITGDIVGWARLGLEPTAAGCDVLLESALAPGNRLLRAVATVARPMVHFGHDWVLDTGARQFGNWLDAG